jgi:hypothetical protein
MSRVKTDTREWTWLNEVPPEIQGERRELMEMLFRSAVRGMGAWTGKSPRTWKFAFDDSGGWQTIVEVRQDQITPSRVASILSGEAFSPAKYEAEVLAILRRLVPTPQVAS